MMAIPDPRNARLLIDVPVILYYNGQHINCSVCHSYNHLYRECPERSHMMKCYSCGKTGHTQAKCPQPHRSLPICYKCQTPGHIARDCPQKPLNQENTVETQTSEKRATDGSRMIGEKTHTNEQMVKPNSLKVVEDLLDHLIDSGSEPKLPELIKRVEDYLKEVRREPITPKERDEKQPATAMKEVRREPIASKEREEKQPVAAMKTPKPSRAKKQMTLPMISQAQTEKEKSKKKKRTNSSPGNLTPKTDT